LVQARNWYEKAAKAGDIYSLGALGSLYEDGRGVEKDNAEALEWYEKGADAGNAASMSGLARLYDKGLGTAKDPNEAARWAIAALDSGDQDLLDVLKTKPDGFSVSMRKQMQSILKDRGFYKGPMNGKADAQTLAALDALFAARESADAAPANPPSLPDTSTTLAKVAVGKTEAAPEVAQCRELSADPYIAPDYTGYDFSEMDAKKAITACTKATAVNPEDASLFNLLGRAAEAKKDFALARKSYTHAAEHGDVDAGINLALLNIAGLGAKPDVENSLARLQEAADSGNANAPYRLAILYGEGTGVEVDLPKAFNWLKQASDAGNVWAMGDLAVAYDNGLGTAKSPELAANWAIEAIRKGNNEVLEVLKTSADDYSIDARKTIQKKLVELGYLKGSVTGKFGPATSAALDLLLQNG